MKNIEIRNSGNQLHNEDGPALVFFSKQGKKLKEIYYRNGKLFREAGPAVVKYTNNPNYFNLNEKQLPEILEFYNPEEKLIKVQRFYPNTNVLMQNTIINYQQKTKEFLQYYKDGKLREVSKYIIKDPSPGSNIPTYLLHDNNAPAFIRFARNGSLQKERYYKNGKLHLIGGPAKTEWFFESNRICLQEYYKQGQLHNDNGPSVQKYHDNGNIYTISYYIDGIIHRENNKPAYQSFFPAGRLSSEKYYEFGELHRENDKPAHLEYYMSNNTIKQTESLKYLIKGKPARLKQNKPIQIEYNLDGSLLEEIFMDSYAINTGRPATIEYYINGSVRTKLFKKYGNNQNTIFEKLINYTQIGNIFQITYFKNGNMSHNVKPANIIYNEDTDDILKVKFRCNNKDYTSVAKKWFSSHGLKYDAELTDHQLIIRKMQIGF